MRFALVTSANVVDNIIVWGGGESLWPGMMTIQLEPNEQCEIGNIYQPGQTPRFVPPEPPAEEQP